MITSTEEAVELAANWMDGRYPGWEHDIHPTTLDIDNSESCVIAQAVGSNAWEQLYDSELGPLFAPPPPETWDESPKWLDPFADNDTKPLWLKQIGRRLANTA